MAVRPQAQKSSLPDHAEVIGDVVEGEAAEGSGLDEYGFTPEERAAFDSMKEGPQDSEGPAEPMPTEPEADPAAAAPDPAAAQVDPNAPPAPAPGPTEEDDDSPDVVTTDPKTGKVQKTINYGKHQRLMTKAQTEAAQIREQLNQERLNQAKLAERLQILNDALMAPAPADPAQSDQPENPMQEKTIDPAEDAIGALAQMQRRQIWLADSGVQAQEQVQERIEDQELVSNFERDIRTFTSRPEGQHFMGPDGAYQYLKNARLVQLGISLFDKDPTDPNERFTQQEISKMIEDYNAEERWVVGNALRTGKSPSMAVLKLAKTFGWRPPEAQPASAAQPGAKSQANGGAAPGGRAAPAARVPAAAAAQPAGSAVAKIQAEAEAAALSRSLSDGGGAPPATPLDMEKLLKMNDEEFARYVDNMPEERLQAIMGREFPGAPR